MSEHAHAPGPWKDQYRFMGRTHRLEVYGPNGEGIAQVGPVMRSRSKHQGLVEANGRLIAAAPDLLALAHRVARHPCERKDGNCSMLPVTPCASCEARAVVAKAEGVEKKETT